MKRIGYAVLLLWLVILLIGCGVPGQTNGTGASPTNGTDASPTGDATDGATDTGGVNIRGEITNMQQADGMVRSVLIEGTSEPDTGYDRASVTITEQTRIFRQQTQERVPATANDLQVGQRVEVQFTGPVMESYPVQATASEIVILD